ncbi:MAG: hypothetical protein CMI90_02685 [Pelagibacteraceae bacterium]|nr:hypothetical protein [Pelagibacteraceae bacterium]
MKHNNLIGIYGGAFNPFHNGHKLVIKTSQKILNLKKLYLFPSYSNPMKPNNNLKDFNKNIIKLRLATKDLDVKVSSLEQSLKTKTTYDFLFKINKKCDLNKFVLIIGLDQIWQFHDWYEYEWVVNNINICIINRPRYDANIDKTIIYKKFSKYFMGSVENFLNSSAPNLHFIKTEGIEISSSSIRKKK